MGARLSGAQRAMLLRLVALTDEAIADERRIWEATHNGWVTAVGAYDNRHKFRTLRVLGRMGLVEVAREFDWRLCSRQMTGGARVTEKGREALGVGWAGPERKALINDAKAAGFEVVRERTRWSFNRWSKNERPRLLRGSMVLYDDGAAFCQRASLGEAKAIRSYADMRRFMGLEGS